MLLPPHRRRAKSPPFPRPTGTNLWQSVDSGSGHSRASSGGPPPPQGGRNTVHVRGAGGCSLTPRTSRDQVSGTRRPVSVQAPLPVHLPSLVTQSREAPSPQLHNGDAMTSRATGSSNGGDGGVTRGTASVPV